MSKLNEIASSRSTAVRSRRSKQLSVEDVERTSIELLSREIGEASFDLSYSAWEQSEKN